MIVWGSTTTTRRCPHDLVDEIAVGTTTADRAGLGRICHDICVNGSGSRYSASLMPPSLGVMIGQEVSTLASEYRPRWMNMPNLALRYHAVRSSAEPKANPGLGRSGSAEAAGANLMNSRRSCRQTLMFSCPGLDTLSVHYSPSLRAAQGSCIGFITAHHSCVLGCAAILIQSNTCLGTVAYLVRFSAGSSTSYRGCAGQACVFWFATVTARIRMLWFRGSVNVDAFDGTSIAYANK